MKPQGCTKRVVMRKQNANRRLLFVHRKTLQGTFNMVNICFLCIIYTSAVQGSVLVNIMMIHCSFTLHKRRHNNIVIIIYHLRQ